MLRFGKVGEELGENEKGLAIVRKAKFMKTGYVQFPLLSPSENLLTVYQTMEKRGFWNLDAFHWYAKEFMKELASNAAAVKALENLVVASKDQDINVCCFCNNVTLCHRYVIYCILRDAGAEVAPILAPKGTPHLSPNGVAAYWKTLIKA